MAQQKKVTVFGGGTGSYVVLSALKMLHTLDIAAIVTMMDSGGSTGRLRDQLGVLPPGDLRQCLVALSEAPDLWRRLFTYRFDQGDLRGHNFGNIFISVLQKITHTFDDALDELHFVLQCVGRVIPVTHEHADIRVHYASGLTITGESVLDEHNPNPERIVMAELVPSVAATPAAIQRITESDYIIAGPGDLYSSVIAPTLVDGIRSAIQNSHARIIYIANLMTKTSQTHGYRVSDHAADIARYFGRDPDIVLVHDGLLPQSMCKYYAQYQDFPVLCDVENIHARIVSADLLDTVESLHENTPAAYAKLFAHSLVRHDARKLSNVLSSVISTV